MKATNICFVFIECLQRLVLRCTHSMYLMAEGAASASRACGRVGRGAELLGLSQGLSA